MVMYINRFETRYAGIALTVLLSTALSLPAHAAEIWKVDLARSTFSSASNTLVLERVNAKAPPPSIDAKIPTAGTFLVISNGKIFLAADDATYATSSGTGVRTVDSAGWRG